MKLSILICSIPARGESRADLVRLLSNSIVATARGVQRHENYWIERITGNEAEVIICEDDKLMTIGAKRNVLLEEAKGDYVAHVDDDDMVTADYVAELLKAAADGTDVIVFDVLRYFNGKKDLTATYGIEYHRDYNTAKKYFRIPNHRMCIKRSIATSIKTPDISFGEDSAWAKLILPKLQTQTRIYKMLYEYWFDNEKPSYRV